MISDYGIKFSGSIHTCDLLGMNYFMNLLLSSGLYCTKCSQSNLRLREHHKVKTLNRNFENEPILARCDYQIVIMICKFSVVL